MISNTSTILFKLRSHLFVCYAEGNFLYISSCYGSFKVKFSADFFFFIYESFFRFVFSVFSSITNTLYFSIINQLSGFLFSKMIGVTFGFLCKFKIKGLGYRLYIFKNSYIFRVGYSHNLYFLLPLNICGLPKRNKKQHYFSLRSTDNVSLFNTLSVIQSFRLPDIYSRNGIFKRTDFFFLKAGKKSFML